MVQWLGFGAFTAVTGVQSLVRELKSPKLHGRVQPKQTNKKKTCPRHSRVGLGCRIALQAIKFVL